MTRASLVCVSTLVLAACAAPGPRSSTFTDQDLLAGAGVPWAEEDPPALVSIDEAFGLDDAMRAFVAPLEATDRATRLHRLLGAMERHGLFAIEYAGNYTRTARGTFHDRQGNCLSFTMLFVALAREAGLDVRYQVVDVPPVWTNERGLVVIGSHVNTVVRVPGGKYVVDFNAQEFRGVYPSRTVTDEYAAALFYSNLGAEALIQHDYESSFWLLREAVRAHGGVAAPWVNLGVMYSRQGMFEHAEAAYQRALTIAPREQSALANLVSAYTALGQPEIADEYRQRIRRYRDSNPFYHYAVAQRAYAENRFEEALSALRSAIRLKRDEDEFYTLQGHALTGLGRTDSASASFARARELAGPALGGSVGDTGLAVR